MTSVNQNIPYQCYLQDRITLKLESNNAEKGDNGVVKKKIIVYVSKEDMLEGCFNSFARGWSLDIYFFWSGFLNFQAGMIYSDNIRHAIFISGIPFAPQTFFMNDNEIT